MLLALSVNFLPSLNDPQNLSLILLKQNSFPKRMNKQVTYSGTVLSLSSLLSCSLWENKVSINGNVFNYDFEYTDMVLVCLSYSWLLYPVSVKYCMNQKYANG